ncbi:LysR family transcriptional regulator [Escherichia coli]
MIDWNDYYYFALIADEGSYSQAALRAGVSKSVLSRRMAALEERLGVRLIPANYAASGPDGGRRTVCCRMSGADGAGGTG